MIAGIPFSRCHEARWHGAGATDTARKQSPYFHQLNGEILYNTLFSREEIFAKSEFEIFSREEIFANTLFTRKYLPAKITSRENIFPRKYLPVNFFRAANV